MSQTKPITIDGSAGEGGGQILRSALGLSLVTGRAMRIERIRAGRKRPGLLRQHLAAVRAAEKIGRAKVEGAAIGSTRLEFVPKTVRSGEYQFAVGSAGSATLVLQTVLPALLSADGPTRLMLEGGTHNPWAPPFDFLQRVFLPVVARMGPRVEASLERHGFYPAGGGRFTVDVQPQPTLRRVDLIERGAMLRGRARALVSRLPLSIAQRELLTVRERMAPTGDWPADWTEAESVGSPGPGNCLLVEIECEHATELLAGFGRRGVRAEEIAADVADQARRYLAADVPVGEHLADQLLIPMALAGGGSFRTLPLSSHTTTNLDVLARFLPIEAHAEQLTPDKWQVALESRA